ncbi:Bsp6I family type II restriction endonuclease [Staphylococcus chromogenes]|uniref:Bsp6I family type II restriction endonuclease n=1 Tax=Staphylococcus chromogenes TaxID=46126 RepID=UPI002DB6D9DF|nr:Bsp6I family type II restriction endonuclease [Staphylococcus chromogenes]MEB7825604.1 Bsp6I family type II restriction endonuclease [Staphylococcus chromogenes]
MATLHDYVKIDKSRFNDMIKAYFLWKELNSLIKNSHTRGINFPEIISESLLCYALDYKLNRGTGGDAYDEGNNKVIECKATSNFDKDTSSFSPNEEFDRLYFLRLYQRDDELYIYDTEYDSEKLKFVQVNKKQTLGDQQKQGRRPRFSIIKQIIDKDNIQPIAKIDLRKGKVIRLK